MTTNALDLKHFVIASDSRWSYIEPAEPEYLYYVDDTGFDKIADRPTASMICAGDGLLIQLWRDWFLTPMPPPALPPTSRQDQPSGELKGIVVSLIDKTTGLQMLEWGTYERFGVDALFCGTGATYAMECFSQNWCAKRSVASAAEKDMQTGGETKYVETRTGATNLAANPSTLGDAAQAMLDRGMVMHLPTKTPMTIQEHQNKKGGAQAPLNAANFSLSAPTGFPFREWNDQEKAQALAAMKLIAEREAANKPGND